MPSVQTVDRTKLPSVQTSVPSVQNKPLLTPSTQGGEGGGGRGGGDRGALGPQSVQSEPYAQSGNSEPGPPSSHLASEAQVHVSKQIAGTWGGAGEGCGGGGGGGGGDGGCSEGGGGNGGRGGGG